MAGGGGADLYHPPRHHRAVDHPQHPGLLEKERENERAREDKRARRRKA